MISQGVQAILTCNGLFTSNRTIEQVYGNELKYLPQPIGTAKGGEYKIDYDRKTVLSLLLGIEETELVNECIRSTWVSSQGKFIEAFEKGMQEFTGAKHAIAVTNGTVAIHLAMLALDIQEGDEIITTNFTYVASSNSILYVKAKPVFVDIDIETWNIDVSKIEGKINPKTKAILYTNIYGNPADYKNLKRIAEKHGLYLVEDAAESFGASFEGKMSGTLGDISTFSFFGNKTITTGEGGMVLTSNDFLAKKIRQLKNQGNSSTVRYYHDILGYNYRMTNIQAAIGVAQLKKAKQILKLKRQIDTYYRSSLNDLLDFQKIENEVESSFWMCSVLFSSIKQKDRIVSALNNQEIEATPFFTLRDELPCYERVDNCPNSKKIAKLGINLPSFPGLLESELDRIIKIIRKNL